MRFSILTRVAKAYGIASGVALAAVTGQANAANMQYSCAYTYEDFIHAKLAAIKNVTPAPLATLAQVGAAGPADMTKTSAGASIAHGAAAQVAAPRLSMNGFPIIVLPPGFSQPPAPTPAPVPVPPPVAPPVAPPPAGGDNGVFTVPTNKALPMAINRSSPQGMFFTPQELAVWKSRSVTGPFKNPNDFSAGTPGDWKRIHDHAEAMVNGTLREAVTNAINPDYSTNGTAGAGYLALDTAFAYLITNDPRYANAAKTWLLYAVTNPANDISKRCFTTVASDGVNPPSRTDTDGFLESQWVNRMVMTYDFVKQGMTDSERKLAETMFLKWGYYFAAHMQWGLESVFPSRGRGDYTPGKQINDWAATGPFATRLADTNHDCKLDGNDDQRQVIVHTGTDAAGNPGPAISILSLFFNNRRSNEALSTGLIGLLLQENRLTTEAKRYVNEWLAYSVYSDGSQGEYQRNGDYCIPQQGLIYGAMNSSAALILADGLARKGDTSLYDLKVTAGLFGTQPLPGNTKTLLTPIKHHLDLLTGNSSEYYFERDRTVQAPRAETSLGNQTSHYWHQNAMDNYHDLSYLVAARFYKQSYLRDAIMRVPSAGPHVQPFPGSTGNVPNGFNGASTIFPGVLFMYGELPSSAWPYAAGK